MHAQHKYLMLCQKKLETWIINSCKTMKTKVMILQTPQSMHVHVTVLCTYLKPYDFASCNMQYVLNVPRRLSIL